MGQEHLQLGLLNGGVSYLASAGVAGIHVNRWCVELFISLDRSLILRISIPEE